MVPVKIGLRRAMCLAGLVAFGHGIAATTPISVSNAGFEDGTAGWSGGNNMAIDEQVAHGGRRSISLTVDHPRSGQIYITRQVPVEG